MKRYLWMIAPFALLCSIILPSARAVENPTLTAAEAAVKTRDRDAAIRSYGDYLAQNPNAEDASTQALHLAYVVDWDKSAASAARAAFQSVADKYPGSVEAPEALYRSAMVAIRIRDDDGAKPLLQTVVQRYPDSAAASMARFTLAHYAVRTLRFDDAISAFGQVAIDTRLPPEMVDEARLQTGILSIQKYLTPAYISTTGQAASPPTPQARVALLATARNQLMKVESLLESQPDDKDVHQTAAAFADCGIAEIYLLDHAPVRAANWYQKAVTRATSDMAAPVRTMAMLGLGVALFRQGRMSPAANIFGSVLKAPVTGKVLYGLRVPDFLIPQARIWAATAAHHLGEHTAAMALAQEALDTFHGQEPTEAGARAVWLASTRFIEMMDRPANPLTDEQKNPVVGDNRIASVLPSVTEGVKQ